MKQFIYFFALLASVSLVACSGQKSASASKSQLLQAQFKVPGTCGMCEERIENALSVRGVKKADWEVDSQMLTVIYQPEVINQKKIETLVADAGHDTPNLKASDSAYNGLAGCCKYRDGGKCEMK